MTNVLWAYSSIVAERLYLFGQQATIFTGDTSDSISTNKVVVKQQNSTDALLHDKAGAWANAAAMNDLDWGLVNVVRFLALNFT